MTSTPTPEPERQWVCHKPGWMGPCSPQSTHHNGFDWGCGWTYFPAPSTPGEGTGRPGGWVEGIGWVALLCDLAPGDVWAPHLPPAQPTHVVGMRHNGTMGASVPFSPSVVIITRWADGTTPAPPASPAPPTPTPCPYIVTADEGTSHCSLAESRPAPPAVPGERWSCASCGATNGACAGKISQGEGGCCSGCDHRSNRPSASGLTINTGWPAPPPVPEAGDEQRHADGVTGEPEWGERP